MKKLTFTLLLFCISFIVIAQDNEQPEKRNYARIGLSYVHPFEENGWMAANEFGFGIGKRIHIGPEFYFAESFYNLDSKNSRTFFLGANLNVYYSVIKKKNWKLDLGVGYGYRHSDATWEANYPGGETDVRRLVENKQGFVFHFDLEKNLNNNFFIGLRGTYQAFGTERYLFGAGFYTGVKF